MDEDDAIFAARDGCDAKGNPRVDVDLPLPSAAENTEIDAVMEDSHPPHRGNIYTSTK